MCNCSSYNRPDWGGTDPEVVVPYRDFFPDSRQDTVCVDACIEAPMRALWAEGVETLGCCCGHNLAAPNIVVARAENVEKACRILAVSDDRMWQVIVWAGNVVEGPE